MERRTPHTMYELLQQDQYRADEVAKLLEIGIDIVRHAAFTGELRAEIVGHHILRLRRNDVLAWVEMREGRGETIRQKLPSSRAPWENTRDV
jgi:excisionase family DNA binding protein